MDFLVLFYCTMERGSIASVPRLFACITTFALCHHRFEEDAPPSQGLSHGGSKLRPLSESQYGAVEERK